MNECRGRINDCEDDIKQEVVGLGWLRKKMTQQWEICLSGVSLFVAPEA